MYRIWTGEDETRLLRGPIYPTLQEALERAHVFAETYMVKIEVDRGTWHVFEQTGETWLGPGFNAAPEPKADPARAERRRFARKLSPLPPERTKSVTWNQRPIRVLDVSWTGAKLATRPHSPPHAGDVVVVEVRAFGLLAHLAGQVRWVREGECGIAFDEALMSRSSSALLELVLGSRDAP